MDILVPSPVDAWGDFITRLWSCELLKSVYPDVVIHFDPMILQEDLRAWVSLPWANHVYPIDPNGIVNFDSVLVTHHRHHFAIDTMYYPRCRPEQMRFFDAHGLIYRFICDDWYPTFIPSLKLEQLYQRLNLPEVYDIVHFNKNDNRGLISGRKYYRSQEYAVMMSDLSQVPMISTGDDFVGAESLNRIPPWLKILVMIRARKLWVTQTGFTSIAAIYRSRKNSFLVNDNYPGSLNVGPPAICYSNYHVCNQGSRRALYYAVEKGLIPLSRGREYWERCLQKKNLWCQFENFDYQDFPQVPEDYEIKPFYRDIENCMVPYDAVYGRDNSDRTYDYRFDEDAMLRLSSVIGQGFRRRA